MLFHFAAGLCGPLVHITFALRRDTPHFTYPTLRPDVGLQRDCLFETYTHKVVRYSSLQDTCYSLGLGEATSQ